MEKQGFSTDEWSEKLTTYSLASVARKKKIFYSHYLGDFGSCGVPCTSNNTTSACALARHTFLVFLLH